ncbi:MULTISPECIES: alpha/beta fold hydrolase [Actinomycetes]|uniref:Alpha/beta hydrolase n=2 Tax=Actinomycetes TaxID=1760 RepID=A0ABN3KSS3_9ACTN|nr:MULTISPECIES: alpha/beta hydrolase [Streptomyces]MCE3032063.1 alpha/beta hydrolase [Streptomyces sp. CMSTAAHL-2]MYQ98655.1 alpha/beta fold hydrolase [Streptomyces sp. SID6139]MYR23397.1 alpha/beta fold hydrolase [Streptomyces sp. SID6137]TGZ12461.1 arylesterase [Streptomyces sp. S816]
MPYFTTRDGTRLHYDDWGDGRPVVLLGAAMADARMWEFQAPFLAGNGLRCVTYDRRGSGRSDKPWTGYDYDTLAGDLADLLDHLDLRDAVLVGYAVGGGECVRYLSRYGDERVTGLALVASTTPYLLRGSDNPDGLDLALFDQIEQAIKADRAAWLSELTWPFFAGAEPDPENLPISPQLARWLIEMCLNTSPRAGIEIYRTLLTTDQRAETAAVRTPTLVIHGTADLAAPYPLCAPRTTGLIPDSRLITYEGAAHGLFATHADRLNADLLAFVKE